MHKHPTFIAQVQTTQKVIAITFDDGPNAYYTPILLDLFLGYNAKATFFTIGQQLEANREIAVAAHAAGHELGNHTYSHPHLPELDREQQLFELEQTERLIMDITGSKPLTFRPPYFEYNEDSISVIESFNYRNISAMNIETEDWREPGVERILDKTRDYMIPGSILLFHDGFGDRSQTVEAVRILLEEYSAQGFQFVTVSE